MLATAIYLALALQQEGVLYRDTFSTDTLMARVRVNRLDPPKPSPKVFDGVHWEFDWLAQGYAKLNPSDTQFAGRFRVYSQERKEKDDRAPMVVRMGLRMWEDLVRKLRLDHPPVNYGFVDYYLCFGGQPGGEQLTEWEDVPNQVARKPVNSIYIYQLGTFKDPVEMAREIAHEYGHAVLPAVGGFKQPEAWSNGLLGEKLFLKWIRDDMVAGRLTPEDAMGASKDGLDAWVKQRVDPLIAVAAAGGPAGSVINEARSGMDSFLGLALYAQAMLPPSTFIRSLTYTRDAHKDQSPPVDYPQQVVAAASEVENLALAVPPTFIGKKIWIPLGKGSCPAATILTRDKRTGWAQVVPATASIVVKNPPIG